MSEAEPHVHEHHPDHAEAAPAEVPAHGMIYHKVAQLPNVMDVEVNLVWTPPWDPKTMASEDVKLALGIW